MTSLSFLELRRQILEQREIKRDVPKHLDHEFLIRKKLLRDGFGNLVQGMGFYPFIKVEFVFLVSSSGTHRIAFCMVIP